MLRLPINKNHWQEDAMSSRMTIFLSNRRSSQWLPDNRHKKTCRYGQVRLKDMWFGCVF